MNSTHSMTERAREAWGEAMPDWVGELAALAEAQGLRTCGDRLGYSPSAISQTIGNKYRGDLTKVEEKVRGALMGLTVGCPILGAIGRDQCIDQQARPKAITNSVRSRLYRACRNGCEHSRLKGGGNAQ